MLKADNVAVFHHQSVHVVFSHTESRLEEPKVVVVMSVIAGDRLLATPSWVSCVVTV